ncbi:tRNA glutamyl-Q(34) synthetase GluQRS [Aquabacter cavernae]|uniref:tRNA glutamyl-Q(34) synthetase GluQRS n=1 Tax=Aquabacter cavernae TaxID=2496029 RepID=UPI000F8D84F3|nr:tRNA glutamyl-Q(34) synthetase GluQRS [Aquabacter cavernae]
MSFVCRFAPSPNGPLHLGHAYSALLNHRAAEKAGGRFLVRIEDIDTERARSEFEAGILDDLDWLGCPPSEPPTRQSDNFSFYAAALAKLEAEGLIYPAFESRAEISRAVISRELAGPWPRDPDGTPIYPFRRQEIPDEERARRREAGEPHVLRLDMARAVGLVGSLQWEEAQGNPLGRPAAVTADPLAWGDVVLARKDTPASYHLAVVLDDAAQKISHVVRGRDLFHATSIHRLLQVLLGLPAPVYHHHRLILDIDGRKLSKSSGARSLATFRTTGALPDDIRRLINLPPKNARSARQVETPAS